MRRSKAKRVYHTPPCTCRELDKNEIINNFAQTGRWERKSRFLRIENKLKIEKKKTKKKTIPAKLWPVLVNEMNGERERARCIVVVYSRRYAGLLPFASTISHQRLTYEMCLLAVESALMTFCIALWSPHKMTVDTRWTWFLSNLMPRHMCECSLCMWRRERGNGTLIFKRTAGIAESVKMHGAH